MDIYNVVKGKIIPITEVNDDVFSKKIIGDGFAVVPEESEIYSPIAGIVTSIFPTKHAITLQTENGVEILIHMGIDTVELKGEPFNLFVEVNDSVDYSTLLATVDLNLLKSKGKEKDILVVFTKDSYSNLKIDTLGIMKPKTKIGYLELK